MKKSNFIAMVLGTVAGLLFALGMCMALLPEWNALTQGIVIGGIGLLLGLITVLIWRKMENKAPLKISGKSLLAIAVGIAGTILLGVGMCFVMVWNRLVLGIVIGILGIVSLLSLIPIISGLSD